jgi:hypothetical protein
VAGAARARATAAPDTHRRMWNARACTPRTPHRPGPCAAQARFDFLQIAVAFADLPSLVKDLFLGSDGIEAPCGPAVHHHQPHLVIVCMQLQ